MNFSPSGDQANYLFWVEYMVRTKTPVWVGYYSFVPNDHPGPILFHVLLIGRLIGGVIPGSPVEAAALVSWLTTCYALVAYSCIIVARARKNAYLGLGVLAVYAVMVHAAGQYAVAHGPQMLGFQVMPVYGPVLAAHIMLAMLASLFALVSGMRRAAYGCILVAGFGFQAFLELVPAALMLGSIGIAVVVVQAVSRRRRGVRAWSCMGWAALCWSIGFGPFLIRMLQSPRGLGLPAEYIRQILDTMKRFPKSGRVWPDHLEAAWQMGSWTVPVAVAVGIVPVIGLFLPSWRRTATAAVAVVALSLVYLFTATHVDVHQTSPLVALPPLILAPPIVGAVRVLRRWGCAADLAVVVAVGVLVWRMVAPYYGSVSKPNDAFNQLVPQWRTPVLIREAAVTAVGPGATIAYWTRSGDPLANEISAELLTGYVYEAFRGGLDVCIPRDTSAPGTLSLLNLPSGALNCREDAVDVFVVFAPAGQTADPGAFARFDDAMCAFDHPCTVEMFVRAAVPKFPRCPDAVGNGFHLCFYKDGDTPPSLDGARNWGFK